jgi:hypothetical protein
LLTQTEALSYAWHLAAVAAAHEPNPQRAHELDSLSQTMQGLHGQALSLLAVRANPAKASTRLPPSLSSSQSVWVRNGEPVATNQAATSRAAAQHERTHHE